MTLTALPAPPCQTDPATLREMAADPWQHRRSVHRLKAILREEALAPSDELALRTRLADELRALGRHADALAVAATAVALAASLDDVPGAQRARVQLAQLHRESGDAERADRMFAELLTEADQMCDLTRAFTLHHAGQNHFEQGRYEQAAPYFAAATRLRERIGAPAEQIARSHRYLAETHRRVGRTPEITLPGVRRSPAAAGAVGV
jgi:tetratricopeptide (TPR) repeat protein